MYATGFTRRLSLVIALGLGLSVARTAHSVDLEDMVVNLVEPLGGRTLTTAFDCTFHGLCESEETGIFVEGFDGSDSLTGLQLDSLASVTSGVVNDRIVPLSSSVSGFTYDYNPDLDVYDRSTKTFGPLFSERAQTIGRRRFLVGMSGSYLEFNEFDGDDLDSISLSELGGDLQTSGSSSAFQGVTLLSLLGTNQPLDVDLDMSIKEWVSTAYFTYGLTERIDVGIVVPLMRLTVDAKATTRAADGSEALPNCSDVEDILSTEPCIGTPTASSGTVVSSNSDKESYTGIGDLVVRGKWNFFNGVANAALTAEATIPTGDPDNLTGLHTMTYRPGLVVSKDFETAIGGLGLQAYAGYNFRPDIPDEQEFDWAVGGALQPFGRASISLDLIGSNETRGDEVFMLDGSVGLKLMLAQNVLVDFNWIAPLNHEGLRPKSGIFTFQIEGTFGD